MGMRIRAVLKLVTPPGLIHLARKLRGNLAVDGYGLSGDYRSWDEAMSASTGYDSGIILEKTRLAMLKVQNGQAAYERDSVLFDQIQYAWPLLAGLMWVAARSGGRLNVLDFGGSLGSTYFQNRAFVSTLPHVRWNIIEQSRHVETGKAYFEDDHLRFYADIAGCLAGNQPNVVLLSSVLQYLEDPYAVLEQILAIPCECIIIDRTPFWTGPTDRLCVQHVPPDIYPATYPCYILSMPRLHAYLEEKSLRIMAEFDSLDSLSAPVKTHWKGLILERK
jgi:putative methyltransferase (TIGR04325 family)